LKYIVSYYLNTVSATVTLGVSQLLDSCFIREVTYPQWIANVVMVQKKNGKWWMCTDFTNLNKCLPKDDFPLTRIDMFVDSTTWYEMMALLDCFSGYHQIRLRKEDEGENTLHYTLRHMPLFENARWPMQRRSNILQNDEGSTKRLSGQKCVLIC
jgi:hypothetical protein